MKSTLITKSSVQQSSSHLQHKDASTTDILLVTKVEYFIYALFGEALNVLIQPFLKILMVFLNSTKAAHIQIMQALQSSHTTLSPALLITMPHEGHFISAHGDHKQF